MKRCLLFIALVFPLASPVFSKPFAQELDFAYFADPSAQMTLTEVQTQKFTPGRGRFNFGFTQSAYWFRFSLPPEANKTRELILSIGLPTLDWIDLYEPLKNGDYRLVQGGEMRSYSKRDFAFFLFSHALTDQDKNLKGEYFLRIQSQSSLHGRIFLQDESSYVKTVATDSTLFGLIEGFCLILMIYNLFLFWATKERVHLYFVFYLGFILLTVLSFYSLTMAMFWPESPKIQEVTHLLWPPLFFIFGTLFSREFIQSKKYLPRVDRWLVALLFIYGATLASTLVLSYQILAQLELAVTLLFVLSMISLAMIGGVCRLRGTGFFAAGWFVFILFLLLLILRLMGWIHYPSSLTFLAQLPFVAQALLLAIGLADRVRQLNREKDAAKLAQQAAEQEAKQQFLFMARLSHEIRTPLNAVLGFAHLLEEPVKQKEKTEFLGHILRGGTALLRLIDEMLDLARIHSDTLILEPKPFNLAALIKELCHAAQLQLKKKEVTVSFKLDPALPRQLVLDPYRLRQILSNLLTNATKFTPKGRILLGLKVSKIVAPRLDLEIFIEDTGIGFDPQKSKQIFLPFAQLGDGKTQIQGSAGLGLAISK